MSADRHTGASSGRNTAANPGPFHPFDRAFRQQRTAYYPWLHAEAPVYRVPGPHPIYILSRYDDVKAALLDKERFSNVEYQTDQAIYTLITSDPPIHTRQRAAVQKTFTPGAIRQVEQNLARLIEQVVDQALQQGELDAVPDFADRIPLAVIGELLGVPMSDHATQQRIASLAKLAVAALIPESGVGHAPGAWWGQWRNQLLALPAALRLRKVMGPKSFGEMVQAFGQQGKLARRAGALPTVDTAAPAFATHVRALFELIELLFQRFRAHQAQAANYVIDNFVTAVREGVMTENEAVMNAMFFIIAGLETTSVSLQNSVVHLAGQPALFQQLRADLSLVPAYVEELLRWKPPSHVLIRQVHQPVTLHGTTMPAGSRVLLYIAAAGRDASRFPDPDRFDLQRAFKGHLAFGMGVHVCIGAPLARMELSLTLQALLARVERIELLAPPRQPDPADYDSGIEGWLSVPVRFPGA